MNEISVNVKQEPGKVTWNFEEIKTNLEAALAAVSYTHLDVYKRQIQNGLRLSWIKSF